MPTEYNPQLIDNMSAKFRRLNNPAHAMADAIGMLQMFPGLRGLWSMGNVNSSGEWIDASNNGLNLSSSGVLVDGRTDINGLAPAALFGSQSHYLSAADSSQYDIIGNESYIRNSLDFRGLTLGAWVRLTATANEQWVLSKWQTTGNQRSYTLIARNSSTANPRFAVSGDGSASLSVTSSIDSVVGWSFIVGRYRSEVADISINVNGAWDTYSTSVPSSLFDSSAAFQIGDRDGGPGIGLEGRLSLAFICAAAVPDIFIDTFFQFTAPLFGVSV